MDYDFVIWKLRFVFILTYVASVLMFPLLNKPIDIKIFKWIPKCIWIFDDPNNIDSYFPDIKCRISNYFVIQTLSK